MLLWLFNNVGASCFFTCWSCGNLKTSNKSTKYRCLCIWHLVTCGTVSQPILAKLCWNSHGVWRYQLRTDLCIKNAVAKCVDFFLWLSCSNKQISILNISALVVGEVKNMRSKEEVKSSVRTSVMSKQYGNEDFLADLIINACGKSTHSSVDLWELGGNRLVFNKWVWKGEVQIVIPLSRALKVDVCILRIHQLSLWNFNHWWVVRIYLNVSAKVYLTVWSTAHADNGNDTIPIVSVSVLTSKISFNVDNVRVCKILVRTFMFDLLSDCDVIGYGY